jgi:hypothetical protein
MSWPVGMMPSDKAGRITQRWFHRRLSPVRGGANEWMPTAFKWAYANWDNAEPFIPSEAQNGRRSGDGDHALAAREPRFSGDLEGTLLLFRIALHRMSYTDLGVSSPAPPARAAAAPLPFSPGWQQPTPQPQVRHPSVHQAVSPLHQPQTPSRSAPDPYPHTARGYLHGRKLGPQSISQDRLVSKAAMALSRSRGARTSVMSCCATCLTTSKPIPRAPPVTSATPYVSRSWAKEIPSRSTLRSVHSTGGRGSRHPIIVGPHLAFLTVRRLQRRRSRTRWPPRRVSRVFRRGR